MRPSTVPKTRNPPAIRILPFAAAALLVPGIPFLILGERFEESLTASLSPGWPPQTSFLAIVGLLSADLLLPVPSSAVSTYAGNVLGVCVGGWAVWLGMTSGAVIGFAVARIAGPALLRKLALPEDDSRLQRLSQQYGTGLIVVTRPLPLLAEAAVVLTGSTGLSWKEFLFPVCLSNAVIAFGYVVLGSLVDQGPGLVMALVASIVIPLSATFLVRRWLPQDNDTPYGGSLNSAANETTTAATEETRGATP